MPTGAADIQGQRGGGRSIPGSTSRACSPTARRRISASSSSRSRWRRPPAPMAPLRQTHRAGRALRRARLRPVGGATTATPRERCARGTPDRDRPSGFAAIAFWSIRRPATNSADLGGCTGDFRARPALSGQRRPARGPSAWVSWASGPNNTDGCGGLTGVTPAGAIPRLDRRDGAQDGGAVARLSYVTKLVGIKLVHRRGLLDEALGQIEILQAWRAGRRSSRPAPSALD